MSKIQIGLEALVSAPSSGIVDLRLGLLCNVASVDRSFKHARFLIAHRFPGQLRALFSPQHGFFAEKQDNMIESDHMIDPVLNIPVFSLYGRTRIPTKDMFDTIDVLVVDLQDVGTRVYTFVHTVSLCMEAAKTYGKRVIILDRPNPIGGIQTEGNCLTTDCASFVGRFPIPMRHGLTIGELSAFLNQTYKIDCGLEVVPMKGWVRTMYHQHTGLAWIPPSPNLPTPISATVYPGQVLWEGTNVSEGRGTTQPFELFGAPFVDTAAVLDALKDNTPPGIVLRPVAFEPTSNKWQGQGCSGFQIHVTDPMRYSPYIVSLRLVQIFHHLFREQFQWISPPYEYEYERLPMDLIIGDSNVRKRIENLDPIEEIEASWKQKLDAFTDRSRQFHLYK